MAFALAAACTPTASSESSSSGGDGASSGSPGGASSSSGGSSGASGGPELPAGTLLYVRAETKDHDILVARDLESGDERVVTDLTGDGSSGWNLDSYALSADRRRIAIASLYGPTKDDTATGLATRAIWSLATDGTDFRRLTPTFANKSGGRSSYQIDVGKPMWTADGSSVVYGFGEYWMEGSSLKGGSFPWVVSAAGGGTPAGIPTSTACTVIYPSRNPKTGDMLYIHNVCIPGQGERGLYLYPEAGSKSPQKLLDSSASGIDIYHASPSWLADGSGFLFIGSSAETNQDLAIFAYDASAGTATIVATSPADTYVRGVAISPDATKIVYCLETDSKRDLHLLDISKAPATDKAITSDRTSCHPSF
ncbi:MAG: hypothetical protein KF764_15815 [Labilithrix sp.]|nr:hypothetical protein [Labilithrix sp.]